MNEPKRIQLSRKRGWRLPPNTVVVSRPSKWGNPYRVGDRDIDGSIFTQGKAVIAFAAMMAAQPYADLSELRGKNLACWCKLEDACHADVLLAIANKKTV